MTKTEVICELCTEHFIIIQKEDSATEPQCCPFCSSVLVIEDLEPSDDE